MKKLVIIILVFMATAFIFADMAKAQLVMDGLVAYWSLDKSTINGNKVQDVIGENHGTITGAKSVAGKFGEALEFNGSSDKVDIPGTDDLSFGGKSEITVAAWFIVKGHSGSCCDPLVAQRDVTAWALRYDNRDAGAELEFIVCPGWVGDGANFGAPVPKDEEWHYLAGVCTGKELLIYLDGVLAKNGTIAFPGAISSGGTATTLGGASDGYFKGVIDEAVIYDRALTDKEVMQNFQTKFIIGVDPKSKLATCWGKLKIK